MFRCGEGYVLEGCAAVRPSPVAAAGLAAPAAAAASFGRVCAPIFVCFRVSAVRQRFSD